MPTLFISYRKGTAGLSQLISKLEERHYRVWIDKEDLYIGDNWQQKIDTAIDNADAVILALTHDVGESKYVRHEIAQALSKDIPIYPIQMGLLEVSDSDLILSKLGLESLHYGDLTAISPGDWNNALEKLLEAFAQKPTLHVTQHVKPREYDDEGHTLHQQYLNFLVDKHGRLDLSQIDPNQDTGILLEEVFIDLPTSLELSVEILNWHVVNWWITTHEDNQGKTDPMHAGDKFSLHKSGQSYPAIDLRLSQLEKEIQLYHEQFPDEKPSDRFNSWRDGTHRGVYNLVGQDLCALFQRVVIVGGPGSGKSTLAKYLVMCLAGGQIDKWNRSIGFEQLRNWPHGALTPVYVELREFVSSPYFPQKLNEQPTVEHLRKYIDAEILGESLRLYSDKLWEDLTRGYAVLILDGLDEVPFPKGKLRERQKQLQNLAYSIVDRFRESRIVVTSRPYAYEGWALPSFQAVSLVDLDEERRQELLEKLFAQTRTSFQTQQLMIQLRDVEPELRHRPLFLTLMATIFLQDEDGKLPARKGALYHRSITLLLERRAKHHSLDQLLSKEFIEEHLLNLLGDLAYQVHSQFGTSDNAHIPLDSLRALLMKMALEDPEDVDPVSLYLYLTQNTGVFISPGQDQETEQDIYQFAHRTFQEYLAAVYLVRNKRTSKNYGLIRKLLESDPMKWRNPCLLTADVLVNYKESERLWGLIDDLLDDSPTDTSNISGDDMRWHTVWLAGQMATEHGLYSHQGLNRRDNLICDCLVNWLVAATKTHIISLKLSDRVECGASLGLLGDPRPGVYIPAENPEIEWVEVSPGDFIYQVDKRISLPAYAISKYPVTFGQFQRFLDAADGFQNTDWWTDLGMREVEPGEQPIAIENHPRVGVSWYDAVAFCRWLSSRIKCEVRLPTEEEWEKAARGESGRKYPWGGSYIETIPKLRRTTAVGIFPEGATPLKVMDLGSNVREWCLNEFEQPDKKQLAGIADRVVRGGLKELALAANRFSANPTTRSYSLGFRLVKPLI